MNFSVIIPAKDEERNIVACLRSVFAVDWDKKDYEVLLIDNGSEDRTAEIARECGAKVFSRPGDTIAALRNYGAQQAQGGVLVFLDADCTVSPDWFIEAARYLDRPEVVCFGSPPVVPPDATWVQKAWFHVRRKKWETGETDWLESMNMFVRKESFLHVGGFKETLITCEDYDLSLRLRGQGQNFSDSRIMAVHHGEAASIPHFFRKELWRGTSNLQGVASHGFTWRELPSLGLPIFYGLGVCLCLLSLVASSAGLLNLWGMIGVLVVWQAPLVSISILKGRKAAGAQGLVQLYFLFNIYFAARAGAMLPLRR